MGRKRSNRDPKPTDLEDYEALVQENGELKKENARLKKLLKSPSKEPKEEKHTHTVVSPSACPTIDCRGQLRPVEYSKLDVIWSFLKCDCCQYRSKGKKVA